MNKNYGLYLARIVANSAEGNTRLRVKVLPYMESLDDYACPEWSCFNRQHIITGDVGDLVWVVANDDFSLGYIIGYANYTTYSEETFYKMTIDDKGNEIYLSIPPKMIEDLNKKLHTLDSTLTISLENVEVTYWDNTCIHLTERNTGAMVIAYTDGTFYIMSREAFFVNVMGKAGMKISEEGVSIFGNKINLQSDSVGLGSSPSNPVLVTGGDGTTIGMASKTTRA